MSGFVRAKALNVFALSLGAGLASADGVTIDHKPVGCVVAGGFPVISAHLDPVARVNRARVYFRAAGGPSWYFVEMKVDQGQFTAALPKPKKSTAKIEYYIEAIDNVFAESRTAEYTSAVVQRPGECGEQTLVAAALTSAKLAVGTTAGAPAVPAGFSAAGVVPAAAGGTAGSAAASGGFSKMLLIGAVGAGAAVATVAVVSGGSDESAVDVSGHWVGVAISVSRKQDRPDCTGESDLILDISQTGSSFSGTGTSFERIVCGENDGLMTITLTGSLSGNSVTTAVASGTTSSTGDAVVGNLTGTVAGNRMSGTLTGRPNEDETVTGTWVLNRQ